MPYEEYIPFSELGIDKPEPGWVGKICYTAEVMAVEKDGVRLQKHGKYEISEPFKDISLEEMRKKIGTVDDEEEPVNKSYKE